MKRLRRIRFHSAGRLLLWNCDKKRQMVKNVIGKRKVIRPGRKDNCWEKHPEKAPEWGLLKKRSEAREGPPPPTG